MKSFSISLILKHEISFSLMENNRKIDVSITLKKKFMKLY